MSISPPTRITCVEHRPCGGAGARPALAWCFVALIALAGNGVTTAGWDTLLDDGQQVSVDLATNRAVIVSGEGAARPLWDGVHRLHDGSTIMVRAGVVVPNAAMQDARSLAPGTPAIEDAADVGAAAIKAGDRGRCDELVLRCCGLQGSCADSEACSLAMQLSQMRHQPCAIHVDHVGWAEQQCRDALGDAQTFTVCSREPVLEAVACAALHDRVCSAKPRCARSPACREARELLQLEQAARGQDGAVELDVIRSRCVQVLLGQVVFPPCR